MGIEGVKSTIFYRIILLKMKTILVDAWNTFVTEE